MNPEERFVMRHDERRKLLIIEQNLVAEAPELAALFGTRARPGRRAHHPLITGLLIGLLVLGVLLDDTTIVLGAFALLSAAVVRWIVRPSGARETRRRPP